MRARPRPTCEGRPLALTGREEEAVALEHGAVGEHDTLEPSACALEPNDPLGPCRDVRRLVEAWIDRPVHGR